MHHSGFVHLHIHSEYSLLDGACRIPDLMAEAQAQKMPALALTDHGCMFGAIEFYKAAIANGIKPIIGCETYVAPKSRLEKTTQKGGRDTSFHLVLLAKNYQGYKNLIRLTSEGYLAGFYYKPRIDKEFLAEHSEGLIGMSACMKGEIPYLLFQEKYDEAAEAASAYRDILGEGNFYLEIMENGMEEQVVINKRLIELSQKLSIPLVATNDCHYMKRSHARAHEVLLCLQTGKTLSDEHRMKMSTDEFYFKSTEEMYHAFRETPQALTNTVEIAQKCNLEIEFGKLHLPHYEVPEGYTLGSYLKELAETGLKGHYPHLAKEKDLSKSTDPAVERLNLELDVISRMNFPGYFLITWDFIKFARDHLIPVGPGRGSAAGSLVAYCLGITDIDPLKYHLLFERFLNPERVSMPDIDIDFCMDKRQQVIDYVADKYGHDNVAQIITFGTMAAKGVIRDVGRVMGVPYSEVDKIAKMVPNVLNIKLDEAIATEERLAQLEKKDDQVRDLLDIARTLEGISRHASTHAAGIVITPKPLLEYVPLYKADEKNGNSAVTQYTMKYLEGIGLLKMDFLGLRTLTVIAGALQLVKESQGEEIDIRNIPMDDKETFKLLTAARTVGVFQLESSGMRDLLRRLKPETFEDVIALVALFRPGPLGSGMVDDFILRKHGLKPIEYELPQMEDILKETYGVMVYQEQVIQVASRLASFSLGEADILRRAMGKKNPAEMDKQREKFVKGAKGNKIAQAKAEKIFDLMAYFAGYGFNKSHSAAYAMIAYQTAYLKAHHPIQYLAALLNCEMDNTDKVVKYINECRELDIKILPPDVNESRSSFSVVKGNIRFGLAAVKNVGEGAVKEIIACREDAGAFTSLFDFANRVDLRVVNRRVVESLIKCGAYDSTGAHRSQLMHVLDEAIEDGQKQQRDRLSGQMNLFNALEENLPPSDPITSLPKVEKWNETHLLSLEKEVLGFYITGHPLAQYEKHIKKFAPYTALTVAEVPEGQRVALAGLVSQIKEIRTKKGERMAFITLEDMVGLVEVVVLPDVYTRCENLLGDDVPVYVSGEAYKKDDTTKIRAAEILSLNEIREKKARRIHINIFTPGLTEDTLKELKNDLSAFHGKCEVYFHLRLPNRYNVVLKASRQWAVSPNEELMVKLEQIFGSESVYLE